MDLKVMNNRFIGATSAYMYRYAGDDPNGGEVLFDMGADNNVIQLKAGQKLSYQRSETIEKHAEWSKATGFDKNSQFIVG